MTPPKHDQPPDGPFGTQPPRSRGPLVVLIVLFAIWFIGLVWLALRYPAR